MSTQGQVLVILTCIALFWAHSAPAQGPDTLWTQRYGGLGWDEGYSVEVTSDGCYMIAGTLSAQGTGTQLGLMRVASNGDSLWARMYGSGYGYSLEETMDGGYVVAGTANSDVYLVKVDADGDSAWTRRYGGATSWAEGHCVREVSDGGYVIAGWIGQNTPYTDYDMYVIRTDADGDTLWTRTYGVSGEGRFDLGYAVLETPDGGFLAAGETESDMWLVRMDASGDTLWTRTHGGAALDEAFSIQATSDGGYIVCGYTQSFGPGTYSNVYLVKTDASGDSLWHRAYGGEDDDKGRCARQTSDGGYVIVGSTCSNGPGARNAYIIKTDAAGDTVWTRAYGDTLRLITNTTAHSVGQTSDAGLIIAGEVHTHPQVRDIYLIRTEGYYPVMRRIIDVPGDQGRQVSVSWHRSCCDAAEDTVVITGYSLWRRVDDLLGGAVLGCPKQGQQAAGLISYPPGEWHYVTTVPARGEYVYSCVAPTLCDSTSEGLCWSAFFVSAMTSDPLVYFDSEPDSGYSIDNLAPSPPANLRMTSPTELAWDECLDEDFNYFTVYGSDGADMDSTAVLIDHTVDISGDVSGDIYDYYHVTATDFAGNESEGSSTVNGYARAGDRDDLPVGYALLQNSPNPFAQETLIRFDLPEPCSVTLTIFDVRGRLIKVLTDGAWSPGRHSTAWNGTDQRNKVIGAGIYFLDIRAGVFADTRKVILLR